MAQAEASGGGLASGRIEAVEIDIAAKTSGRIEDTVVDEGDFVQAGQAVANMDITVLTRPTA